MKTARIGKVGYARILRCVADEPATVRELLGCVGIGKTAGYRILPAMHALGLVHVAGWREIPDKPFQPVYGLGKLPDALPPTRRANGRKVGGPVLLPVGDGMPSELIAFAALLRELRYPITAVQASANTGLHEQATRELLAYMHEELKLVRIANWGWRDGGGDQIPEYQFAIDGQDAPRLPRATREQRNARYRARRRSRENVQRLSTALAANSSIFSLAQSA